MFTGSYHKTPKELAEMQSLIDQGRLPRNAIEEYYEDQRKATFGENYKTDPDGNPIEQGLGSHAQPTWQSVQAYKKYGKGEKDYEVNLERLQAELDAYLADRQRKKPGRKPKAA